MVKRKPPIVLGTVLVLGLGVAYYFNSSTKAPEAPPPPPPHDEVTSQPRKPENKKVLAKKMQESMDTHGSAHMPGGAGMVSDAPPDAQQQKPKPSDSMTSSEWYKH